MKGIQIRRPDDWHVHLRDGDMLRKMAPHTSRHFSSALIMPNTTKPILTRDDAVRYRKEVIESIGDVNSGFVPFMTIKLTAQTTPEIIRECKGDVRAAKLYPEGVTTNSEDGVRTVDTLYPVFEEMERVGMVLCIHGETPGVFTLDREHSYLKTVKDICRTFPRLKIVLEHVTTESAVGYVSLLPDTVAATITVHHLFLTLDSVIGGSLKPHLFCKPVAKRPSDRDALIEAATGGNPKFFLGTDSAPHLVGKKECASGCAGVFTAPVAMSCLAELFANVRGGFEVLEKFSSENGCRFYRVSPSMGKIRLVQEDWTVPEQYDGVVPFRAGDTLRWNVEA